MAQTQTLFLLRHAEAEPWYPGVPDIERRLSERGLLHMAKLSEWAANAIDPPALAVCSAATRTRQTLEALQPAWIGGATEVRLDSDMYEATTGYLHSLLEQSFRSLDRVMLIGHNPGLGYLSRAVLADLPDNGPGSMTPGSLAIIEFENGWAGNAGQGRVIHWVNPSQFD